MVIFVSLEMHPKSRTHGLVSIGHDKYMGMTNQYIY